MSEDLRWENNFKELKLHWEVGSTIPYVWESSSKVYIIEGTAIECHNTLEMPDGK